MRPEVVRHEEACVYVNAIEDDRLKAFIAFGQTKVLLRQDALQGAIPSEPFDMEFFSRALAAMFRDQTPLKLIMEGRQEELRWWSDEDQP